MGVYRNQGKSRSEYCFAAQDILQQVISIINYYMESEIKRELRQDDKGTEEDKPMSVDKLIPIICTYLDNSVKYY